MPFGDTEAKKLLHSLIQTFEHLLNENISLKSILMGLNIPHFQEVWPKLLADLMSNPEANQELHAKFLSLYERADRVADESTALELLRLLPQEAKKAN